MMQQRVWFFVGFFCYLMTSLAWGATDKLKSLNIAADPTTGKTRLIFQLEGDPLVNYFFLSDPQRLVIDFEKTKLATALNKVPVKGSAIAKIRSGNPKEHILRVVLEVAYPVKTDIKAVTVTNEQTKKITFNLDPKNKSAAVKIISPPKPVAAIKHLSRDVIVVIDAGHGGKDPGATGNYKTEEKDVVLAIAKELQTLINRQPGMRAVMTRHGNYYVTLRDRLTIARRVKGDIFVAIHADAYKNINSKGASVYALSLKGASSEAARWLAEKENYSELGGVNLHDKDDMLRSVLIDLSQTATISSSLELGQSVLKQLGYIGRLHRGHVEQAPFVVLKSPDIPSILIETGFISNPAEEQKLRSPYYQVQLAQAITQGIKNYFQRNPPQGSIFLGG